MTLVRNRINSADDRIWRLDDFQGLPSAAVAQALSRLHRQGVLARLSKGTYYRARPTAFGKSLPHPAAMKRLVSKNRTVFPSGAAAANLLGFTTQSPAQSEVATSTLSLPRKLIGHDVIVHTRRPEAWNMLLETDAALLDFIRETGRTSELSPEETIRRTQSLLCEKGRSERLLRVAMTEPPRVRAIFGALGESLKKPRACLHSLQASLNPFSRFDSGPFAHLSNVKAWQARNHAHEACAS